MTLKQGKTKDFLVFIFFAIVPADI